MSFEVLEPEEKSRTEEMHGNKAGIGGPADDTKVGPGNNPDDIKNKLSENSDKKLKERIDTPLPKNNDAMRQFAEFKKNNPEPLPYKDLGSEAIAEAGTEVKREGWPC